MEEYYTVSQYAREMGKDPGNIRRMLISGKLKGEKLGNQWIIPKNTVYPEDARVKSGKYHNSRKKADVRKNNPELMNTLNKICDKMKKIYGSSLDQIILYGSYARGEETSESDVDIAVILKQTPEEEIHDSMTDMLVDYELDLGITISAVTLDSASYSQWMRILPFYMNIAKEGIVLWKAA